MQTEEIKVTENGKTITTLTLEDCEKYHGLKDAAVQHCVLPYAENGFRRISS